MKRTTSVVLLILMGGVLMLTACGPSREDLNRATALYRQALGRLRHKDFKHGVELLKQSLAIHPKNINSLILLAQVYQFQRQTADTIKTYEQAFKAASHDADWRKLYRHYGNAMLSLGETARAEKAIAEGLKRFPGDDVLLGLEKRLAVSPGKKAPGFSAPTLANPGRNISLSSLQGKVVLVDFWASWCGPCRSSLPHLNTLYQKLGPKGLVVLGINLDRSKQAAQKLVRELKLGFTNLYHETETQKIGKDYGVTGIPATYLIDKQGVIRYAGHPMQLEEKQIEGLL